MSEANFLHDVRSHRMSILEDDGNKRHLKFSRKNSGVFSFQIITRDSILIIDGDCGTYVFKRLKDMFSFFRMDRDDFNYRKDAHLQANPDYWAEKCVDDRMPDGSSRTHEFSPEDSLQSIKEYLEGCIEPDNLPEQYEDKESYIEKLLDDTNAEEGATRFYDSVDLLEYEVPDISEHICTRPNYHFMWCLYAIVWGILQYDNYKAENSVNEGGEHE